MPASLPETGALGRVLGLLDERYRSETWHWDASHVRGPMDIVAGAVLVQHTTWTNAERALEQLRAAGALEPAALASMSDDVLMGLVRVSGTPTTKARRLRAIAATIEQAGGIDALLALPKDALRARLLATHGIGPETADAIVLYGAGHRTFIIDAYTQRLFRRLGLGPDGARYATWQRWFEERLRDDGAHAFQRHHAHIVLHGKALCRARPRCDACPLLGPCAFGSTVTAESVSAAALDA